MRSNDSIWQRGKGKPLRRKTFPAIYLKNEIERANLRRLDWRQHWEAEPSPLQGRISFLKCYNQDDSTGSRYPLHYRAGISDLACYPSPTLVGVAKPMVESGTGNGRETRLKQRTGQNSMLLRARREILKGRVNFV